VDGSVTLVRPRLTTLDGSDRLVDGIEMLRIELLEVPLDTEDEEERGFEDGADPRVELIDDVDAVIEVKPKSDDVKFWEIDNDEVGIESARLVEVEGTVKLVVVDGIIVPVEIVTDAPSVTPAPTPTGGFTPGG
jgi:hypothetical protein